MIRLQKVLAAAGIGSRRKCEVLIGQGRVSVNGVLVSEQGLRVDPDSDEIRVDGKLIPTRPEVVVLALNKPVGVVSSMADDRGRPCLADLVGNREERLFHVGRLDEQTSGLLLLTNDGELAQRVAHPSVGIDKTYRATVEGVVTKAELRRLTDGVTLNDGEARAESARLISSTESRSIVQLRLHMGRNRVVRRMLAAIGHPVLALVRTSIGPLRLGGLRPGQLRELSQREVAELYAASDLG